MPTLPHPIALPFDDANAFFDILPTLPAFRYTYCIGGYAMRPNARNGFALFIGRRGDLALLPASEAGTFDADIRTALQWLYDNGERDQRRRLLRLSAPFRSGANIKMHTAYTICTILASIQARAA